MKKIFFIILFFSSCQIDSNILKNQNSILSQELLRKERDLDSVRYKLTKDSIFAIMNNTDNCPPREMIRSYNLLSEKLGKDIEVDNRIKKCF